MVSDVVINKSDAIAYTYRRGFYSRNRLKKTRVVELFPSGGRSTRSDTRRKDSSLPSTDPQICATEGLKKMGWVMVGESLLSVGVIAPGVGADFLSTGICKARV